MEFPFKNIYNLSIGDDCFIEINTSYHPGGKVVGIDGDRLLVSFPDDALKHKKVLDKVYPNKNYSMSIKPYNKIL